MRILIYSGKGGVGKTTISAATGVRCAAKGLKTLVLSLDPAHSLADSFDLPVHLQDKHTGLPVRITTRLWIQELDVQEEVERYWGDVYGYLAALFSSTGLNDVVAEELAILPGMEELVGLLYINKYASERSYDVIILDCAPTGESLRFISMPSTLEWYMKNLFSLERQLVRVVRPVAKALTKVPLPDDRYFRSLKDLFGRLEGIDGLLLNKDVTSVRLVTNAEKMILKETQRAFLYFSLFGMNIDAVIVNRILPSCLEEKFFSKWKETQSRYLEEIESRFSPVPLFRVPLYEDEVVGVGRLRELAKSLYSDREPEAVFHTENPYEFSKHNGRHRLRLKLPFAGREHVDLYRNVDELIIRIGDYKRHVPLPRAVSQREPKEARFSGNYLEITFGGSHAGKKDA